jgi:glycosyltransferase involved in cell wall biosynthesis
MPQRPYRILHLTSTSALGGAEQVILELARHSDPARYAMLVVSLDGPPQLTEACRAGTPPVEAEHWGAGRPWPWRLHRILPRVAAMRRRGFHLVQTYGLQADVVGRLLKRRLGMVKLLNSVHSTDAWRSRPKVLLDRWTAGAVDRIVSVSHAGSRVRIERERLDPRLFVYIPNGIEIDPPGLAARDEARRALGLRQKDAPVIAHIANLRPMKGHGEVLTAATDVLARYPSAVFLLAGRDESDGRYQRQAQALGLGDRLRFLGFHPHAREVMRAADLFILPSYYEGCPIAILEAMAERRPIVASNVGGIPELVRHEREALLIEPRHPDALRDAIVRLVEDRALATGLTEAARRRVEAEFNRDTMIRRYCELYDAMIEEREPDLS